MQILGIVKKQKPRLFVFLRTMYGNFRVRGGHYGEPIKEKDEPRGDWVECSQFAHLG